MNKKSIILSANGLKNLLIDKEEDFAFVIGGKEIKMNHIFAEFVSPTVAHVHRSDPTVKKFDLTEHLYDLDLSEYDDKIIKSLNDEKVFSSVFQSHEVSVLKLKVNRKRRNFNIFLFFLVTTNYLIFLKHLIMIIKKHRVLKKSFLNFNFINE